MVSAWNVPAASITVSLAASHVDVGATTTATAQVRDTSSRVLSWRKVVWKSSNPSVATVNAQGQVASVGAGSAEIIASSDAKSDSATLTVGTQGAAPAAPTPAPAPTPPAPAPAPTPPPPAPPMPGSNEPSNFSLITQRDFAAKTESGWQDTGASAFSIQNVSGPRGDGKVGQALFPAGFVAGSGPINTYTSLSGNSRQLYVGMWIKFSPNFVGQQAGINKILFIWTDGNANVFLNAQGTGMGSLVPSINLQNNVGGAVRLTPNVASNAVLTRGEWHYWEVLLTANTVGQLDGSAKWWLDGNLIGNHTGIGPARDKSNRWELIAWNPTWGGAGGTVPADQYQQIDYIKVSGSP